MLCSVLIFVSFAFQKKQHIDKSLFPEWTKSDAGITMPLVLPEQGAQYVGLERETTCLFCERRFGVPSQQPELLQHLLTQHRFVIGDVHNVVDLALYFDYWRPKFEAGSMLDYCKEIECDVETKETKKGPVKKGTSKEKFY